MNDFLYIIGSILGIIIVIIIIWFYIWLLFLLPRNMAKKRGRNPVGWTILFWVLTPFWGAILLLILGDSNSKIKQDIIDEIHKTNDQPPSANNQNLNLSSSLNTLITNPRRMFSEDSH